MTTTSIARSLGVGAAALSLFVLTASASAQFTRVVDLPPAPVFSLSSTGDTIAAGVDTVVYVSTNAGVSWQRSVRPGAGVQFIQTTLVRNGLLYVGTAGKGTFISGDLGASWTAFNDGLVGGILNSQNDVGDFQVRGDSLYAATFGAGVYVRKLTGPSTWHHFGDAFEPEQASNVNDLALGGTRLLASAGSNGEMFRQNTGEPDWTISPLDNVGLHPGLIAHSAAFTGNGWVVGTLIGMFRSVGGQEPWSRCGPNLGALSWTTFATQGRHLFAALTTPNDATLVESDDDGATFQNSVTLPNVFVQEMVVVGNELYTARADGLWRRSIASASVPPGGNRKSLGFALAGRQPFGDQARLRFELAAAGVASLEVFDVLGRRAVDRSEQWWSAGPHEVSLDARRLGAGVYAARLTAGGTSEVVRLVHVR